MTAQTDVWVDTDGKRWAPYDYRKHIVPRLPAVLEVLRDAREIIATHGWTQGVHRDGCGYCLDGALWAAVGVTDVDSDGNVLLDGPNCFNLEEWASYHDAIFFIEQRLPCGMVTWNDADERTAGEVVAMLDAVIGDVEGEVAAWTRS